MQKLKYLAPSALLAFILISCSNSTNSKTDTATLKFNLQKGKAYEYTMDMDSKMELQGQSMNNAMNFSYLLDVVDDNNGVKTLKATYEHLGMKMNSPRGNFAIDSDHPSADTTVNMQDPQSMMEGMFGAMKGKTFTMKVDTAGNISEVSGMREMVDAIVNGMKVPEALKAQLTQTFAAQFNDEVMKQNFSQAFNIYPKTPVKVGDKWDKDMNLGLTGMKMSMKTTYTVKTITPDQVTLDAVSSLDMNSTKATQTGTFVVDRSTGMIIDGTTDQKMDGPMKSTTRLKITGKAK